MVEERNELGTLLGRYVHGGGVDNPLVWYDGSNVGSANRRHLFTNWQGSITAITDDAGTALIVNAYDAYGIPNDTNHPDMRFSYTGQIWLNELGLYHYKARAYSPTLGRFLQTDPIGYEDQFNLYAYVGNDPANSIDPMGMAQVKTNFTPTGSNIARTASVTVDADVDRDGIDDLSSGQLKKIGKDFSKFIQNNDGADISGSGKRVVGSASQSDKAMTMATSQFVGAGLTGADAARWAKDGPIIADARSYGKFGPTAQYGFHSKNGGATGQIIITGARNGWVMGGYLYDSPSNMARALLHEIGHPRLGNNHSATFKEHHDIDKRAKGMLRSMGLDGGGCWGVGYTAGGFKGC